MKLVKDVLERNAKAIKGPWKAGLWIKDDKTGNEVHALTRETGAPHSFEPIAYSEHADAYNFLSAIAHYRTAAPRLAKMLLKAIEQRDAYINVLFNEMHGGSASPCIKERNAELDRIARGEG
jgi:hypothetical protein